MRHIVTHFEFLQMDINKTNARQLGHNVAHHLPSISYPYRLSIFLEDECGSGNRLALLLALKHLIGGLGWIKYCLPQNYCWVLGLV